MKLFPLINRKGKSGQGKRIINAFPYCWYEGAGRGSKRLFLWLLRRGSSIVSIPQKACSALLRGFESRNRDWEAKNRIFIYNAEALKKQQGTRL